MTPPWEGSLQTQTEKRLQGSRFARSPPALSKRTTVRASNGHAKRLYYSQILRSAQDFGCRLPLRSFSACPEQTNDSESVERACKTPLLLPDPSLRSGFRLQAPASLTPAKRLYFTATPQGKLSVVIPVPRSEEH